MRSLELEPALSESTILSGGEIPLETREFAFDGALSLKPSKRINKESSVFGLRTYHLVTIASVVGIDATLELKWHIRMALNDGCTVREIIDVLSLAANYHDAQIIASAQLATEEAINDWMRKTEASYSKISLRQTDDS